MISFRHPCTVKVMSIQDNQLEFRSDQIEGVLVISVGGRIDGVNMQEFHDNLYMATRGSDSPVVLDFENLSYINSGGLRSILVAAKRLRKTKTEFIVCSLSDSVEKTFELVAFGKIIKVVKSRSDALTAITD